MYVPASDDQATQILPSVWENSRMPGYFKTYFFFSVAPILLARSTIIQYGKELHQCEYSY